MWTTPDDATIAQILRETKTIAIVGVSANPDRPSHGVYRYLAEHSPYRIFLVNPTITELDGQTVYPSLAALPETPDLVDVFRRREELAGITHEAIDIGARTLWFQLDLVDVDAANTAAQAGLQVVMDRCTEIEFARLGSR
ncbi:CoA-binding protein [Mycobacteroides immunogenum]|uniref:CoA-binding protein n=1 Tax=Mycobacteroides immunogenum TaxID=83262 RepID=A0A7V8LTR9_9MYCO|nr:CoA-binding protein [Mycobacteroides immunogenum]AMT73093.1 CoA-binding protein [Mycobacteroides immunogenum]ANO06253.1 CoA-binding protein [Mycobacteroides immunogenum]KIU41766.1 CoA-binding protein [Mycobacteroides immunogenum]KPG11582.1 CoA-binding protein [Mycobacteroides immunogenum]KPG11931.1 CoA-binding protein [Mycobacteroides immunogenum]